MKLVAILRNVPRSVVRLGLGLMAHTAAVALSAAHIARADCPHPAGRVIEQAPLTINPNPFGVVYDSENARYIVTDWGGPALYTTDDEGGNEQLWLPAPLSGAGRGIAIGGKTFLGEDRIWVLNDSPSIDRLNLTTGAQEDALPGITGTGLAYNQATNTLFVMNHGRITQYDPLTGASLGSVDTGIPGGLGLAIVPHEHIDAHVFFRFIRDFRVQRYGWQLRVIAAFTPFYAGTTRIPTGSGVWPARRRGTNQKPVSLDQTQRKPVIRRFRNTNTHPVFPG